MTRFSPTERLGVNIVERIFLHDYQWIPRIIHQSDVGIDLEVEVCEDGNPTGQLIAVQIKSGKSFVKQSLNKQITYRGSDVHLNYWLNHCLPVIIVLVNPESNLVIWQKISQDSITKTKKGWKTEIPTSQKLDVNHKNEIIALNNYPPYFQKLQRLISHYDLIKEVSEGEKLVLELSEWVNKSIGRVELEVKRVEFDGSETLLSESGYIFFKKIEDLNQIYPWANFEVDEDYYEDSDEDEYYNNYGIWDPEEKAWAGGTIDYLEYKSRLPKIRYIETASAEVVLYRLEFSLNDLGRSFLRLDDFLQVKNID